MQWDYAKLFLYTIINVESQTLLLRFFLRGGGGCTQATLNVHHSFTYLLWNFKFL